MPQPPILTIRVFEHGQKYRAEFDAPVGDEIWSRASPELVAGTALEAVERVIIEIQKAGLRTPGPKGHWFRLARYLMGLPE